MKHNKHHLIALIRLQFDLICFIWFDLIPLFRLLSISLLRFGHLSFTFLLSFLAFFSILFHVLHLSCNFLASDLALILHYLFIFHYHLLFFIIVYYFSLFFIIFHYFLRFPNILFTLPPFTSSHLNFLIVPSPSIDLSCRQLHFSCSSSYPSLRSGKIETIRNRRRTRWS